jgi:hypothetical protein
VKKFLSKFPVVVWKHLPVAGLAFLPFIFVRREKYKNDLVMAAVYDNLLIELRAEPVPLQNTRRSISQHHL